MKCLLAGATGLVGGHLLETLLADSRVEQIVCVGRKALEVRHPKIRNVETDFLNLDQQPTFQADVAFCCLGTTIKKAGSQEAFEKVDHDFVLNFAKYAQRNAVRKFCLVSAAGADESSSVFYSRVKGKTEKDLEKMGFDSLVVFRPSLLLGDRSEKRFAEQLAIQLYPFYRPLLIGKLSKYAPIEARQVARSMWQKSFEASKNLQVVSNDQMLNGRH